MLYSQFYEAVDTVLGTAYGRSVIRDLYVSSLHGTAQEAIDRGDDPQKVWESLIAELELDPGLAWVHRADRPR